MQNLTRASEELFRRGPDEPLTRRLGRPPEIAPRSARGASRRCVKGECFATFDALWHHCQEAKTRSVDR